MCCRKGNFFRVNHVNNLIIKIEILYEIRTHLLGNHDYRIRRDLRQSLPLPFTCSKLRVFDGANR